MTVRYNQAPEILYFGFEPQYREKHLTRVAA